MISVAGVEWVWDGGRWAGANWYDSMGHHELCAPCSDRHWESFREDGEDKICICNLSHWLASGSRKMSQETVADIQTSDDGVSIVAAAQVERCGKAWDLKGPAGRWD